MFVFPLTPPPALFLTLLTAFDTDPLLLLLLCVLGTPLKPAPSTRCRSWPLMLDTSFSCDPGICFCSVSASGSSDADPYSMMVVLEALALPVPATLKPLVVSCVAVVAARPEVLVAL